MKYTQGEYRLIRKDNLGQDLYRFVLECPDIAEIAAPGQFVHILPKGSTLRRPISICQIDRKAGTCLQSGERGLLFWRISVWGIMWICWRRWDMALRYCRMQSV